MYLLFLTNIYLYVLIVSMSTRLQVDISAITYISFDSAVELWSKIMQIGCQALKAHSTIMCGPPHKSILTHALSGASVRALKENMK